MYVRESVIFEQGLACLDLVKFVMCILVSRVHTTHDVLEREGYTVPGNQGTHDKLSQIPVF